MPQRDRAAPVWNHFVKILLIIVGQQQGKILGPHLTSERLSFSCGSGLFNHLKCRLRVRPCRGVADRG
jgi:hypothetical protein